MEKDFHLNRTQINTQKPNSKQNNLMKTINEIAIRQKLPTDELNKISEKRCWNFYRTVLPIAMPTTRNQGIQRK